MLLTRKELLLNLTFTFYGSLLKNVVYGQNQHYKVSKELYNSRNQIQFQFRTIYFVVE